MNKRGFTLVELISVIAILGLLAIIVTPAYDSISSNIKQRNYESKKNVLKKETIEYVEKYMKNETYDPDRETNVSQTLCFTVNYLIHNGITSSDNEKQEYIENPITGERFTGNKVIINVFYDLTDLKLVSLMENETYHDKNFTDTDCIKKQ